VLADVTESPPPPAAPDPISDPRLDESAWRVFGRRLPRRWSLYARIIAGALLLLSLGWWFTRDVTYVSNVKVAGLDAVEEPYREPLHAFASDFAVLVNRLADSGYGWQAGGLPMLRADGALTSEDDPRLAAVASLEVKKGGAGLREGDTARELAGFMATKGWTLGTATAANLEGAWKELGPLRAEIHLERRSEGREALLIEITPR
jgi:hypothetical protein